MDELPGTLERVSEQDSGWRPMQGSFSDVHRATWRQEDGTEIDVAVKVLRTARISGALSADMMSQRMIKVRLISFDFSMPLILMLLYPHRGSEENP